MRLFHKNRSDMAEEFREKWDKDYKNRKDKEKYLIKYDRKTKN